MPQIDLPLDELRQYRGRNPKPCDFDSYWDRALAELDRTDPAVRMTEAAFQVPSAICYDLYFTGVGGAAIYAKFLRPRKLAKPAPAVLIFHGYSGHSGDWRDKLSYVAEGYCVFAMDVRGQGGKSQDIGGAIGNTLHGHIIRGLESEDPHKILFRDIYLDTAQLARVAMAMDAVDESRVGALGGSQGGGLTLACAALEPRVKRLAPYYPFLSDYRRVWEMDLAVDAYEELRQYFRNFDPQHKHEEDIFTRLGYIDVQHLAPRIRGEVLMATGLMDTICPPSTQFAAYNKITSKKDLHIYPDFGHEFLPGFDDSTFQFMLGL